MTKAPTSTLTTRTAVSSLLLLSVVYCVNFIDRIMIGALGPLLKAEFHLSDTQFGILSGFGFSLCYATAGIPLAVLADRWSRRKLIAISLALWSAMTAMCGLANNFMQLLLLRVAVGIGEAGSVPASYSLISDLFHQRYRPLAMSVLLTGSMLGILLGLSLAGWLAALYGWRTTFFLLGLPGILLSLVVLRFLADPERGAIDNWTPDKGAPDKIRDNLAALWRNKPYVLLTIAGAAQAFSIYGMSQWLPLFFSRTHGLGVGTIALLFGTAFGVGMMIGQLLGGWLGSLLARRQPYSLHVSIYACFLLAPAYVAVLWLPSVETSVGMTFLAAIIGGTINPSAVAVSQTLVAPAMRATAIAIGNFMLALLGAGLAPLLVGVLSDALHHRVGSDALRYALTLAQLLSVMAGVLYLLTAIVIGRRGHGVPTDRPAGFAF